MVLGVALMVTLCVGSVMLFSGAGCGFVVTLCVGNVMLFSGSGCGFGGDVVCGRCNAVLWCWVWL